MLESDFFLFYCDVGKYLVIWYVGELFDNCLELVYVVNGMVEVLFIFFLSLCGIFYL